MNIERKIVFLSLGLLIVSNILIYILFFNIKWEVINISNLGKKSNQNNTIIEKIPVGLETQLSWTSNDIIENEDIFETWLQDLQIEEQNIVWWKLILSWTQLYSWNTEILEKLWIKAKYTLTDENNVFYSYLGSGQIDLTEAMKNLSWNLVEIKDKNIINQNMLFGDILTYINIPDYKGVKTLFMVKFDNTGDLWLLQIDYDKYYKLKKHLKNLFNY